MTPKIQTCRQDQLAAFLDGRLTPREEDDLQSHLDDCASCRRRLDELAAAEDSWTSARSFLKDDAYDRTVLSGYHDSSDHSDEQSVIPPQIAQVLNLLQPTDDPAMLGRLGGYEVSGVVGSGGMGIVLKAFDRPLDRIVAIKVMAPHLATSGAARQRFSREARAAAAVLHPNVIAIYGVSTDASLPYLVMPYVGGASLQKRLDSQGPLPVADILRISIQLAAGLAAAHEQGLVHRDIKPANILLDHGVDRLVITDFGLARAVDDASMTRTGVIAGTPQYMSPEQARGDAVDARSDLFSLGSVLYTMCTGRVPFRADSPYGVLRLITDTKPRAIREINPEIPEWLCRIVQRLHVKMPADRYQSAQEVTALLTQCLAHVTQPTLHPLPNSVASLPKRLSARLQILSSVTIVTAAVIIFAAMNRPGSKPDQISPAPLAAAAQSAVASTAAPPDETVEQDERTIDESRNVSPFDPSKLDAWDDQLDPVLKEVEQKLQEVLPTD